MKVRFTSRSVRVRIADLHLAALGLGPLSGGVSGAGGGLSARIRRLLTGLAREDVTPEGPPRVDVERDFGPQHA